VRPSAYKSFKGCFLQICAVSMSSKPNPLNPQQNQCFFA
jgi:hypothetical protein